MSRRRRLALLISLTCLAAAAPATAAERPLPRSSIEAREAFFGARNVDRAGRLPRDRVILSWFGVASFAASFGGHVVLLDSYINNEGPDQCPQGTRRRRHVDTTYAQLAALKPKLIFIGHHHFDHSCRTGELMVRTGARLVGLPQHCAEAARQVQSYRGRWRRPFRCVPTLPAGAAFGARATIRPLGSRVPVTAIRHVHSGRASGPICNTQGCESMLYRFRVGRFSLAWHDSTGPLREKAPGVLPLMRRLPATDVVFGASLTLGISEQGYRDVVDYPQALRAKVFYAQHQDFGYNSRAILPGLRQAFAARAGLRARLRWLQDPGAYLKPISFDPEAQRWR